MENPPVQPESTSPVPTTSTAFRKPRRKKSPGYRWAGTFTRKPAATNIADAIWATKRPHEKTISYVNIEERTCSSCPGKPECEHIRMAIAQRRHIIHRGLAIRNGREIRIPDADELATAEIFRAYKSSRRARRIGGSNG